MYLQELINAEIAQLTSTTPVAFQHENLAPQEYFKRLIQSFEERMFLYRRQVEEVESHLASLQQPQTISPQGCRCFLAFSFLTNEKF